MKMRTYINFLEQIFDYFAEWILYEYLFHFACVVENSVDIFK